jgi:hypothetical protein
VSGGNGGRVRERGGRSSAVRIAGLSRRQTELLSDLDRRAARIRGDVSVATRNALGCCSVKSWWSALQVTLGKVYGARRDD